MTAAAMIVLLLLNLAVLLHINHKITKAKLCQGGLGVGSAAERRQE